MRPSYDDSDDEQNWSSWRSFPDPRRGEMLVAPMGPGVYELRVATTGELLLFGIGRSVAHRMATLLPEAAGGVGGRRNDKKREAVLEALQDLEYRTLPCRNRAEAKTAEDALRLTCRHRFKT